MATRRRWQLLFAARPDVLNHNMETVPRLQRAVRPSAGYARSLSVLARAKAAGLSTKSGLVVGMGETDDEVDGTLADLAGIGVDIVTIGQYLRPTSHHLPVARWVEPEQFDRWAATGRALGLGHVEASPLTRSSYHARQAADAASGAGGGAGQPGAYDVSSIVTSVVRQRASGPPGSAQNTEAVSSIGTATQTAGCPAICSSEPVVGPDANAGVATEPGGGAGPVELGRDREVADRLRVDAGSTLLGFGVAGLAAALIHHVLRGADGDAARVAPSQVTVAVVVSPRVGMIS